LLAAVWKQWLPLLSPLPVLQQGGLRRRRLQLLLGQ
jgi:hypothetical protein